MEQRDAYDLAYLIDGPWILSMSSPTGKDVSAIFAAISADLAGEVRGSSGGGPDPAGNAAETRIAWRARSVSELTPVEALMRLRAAGASASRKDVTGDGGHRIVEIGLGSTRGALHLVAPRAKAEAFLADLRSRAVNHCASRDGDVLVVAAGAGEIGAPGFLRRVLDGLPGDVACAPR